jgi:hypothetical protein
MRRWGAELALGMRLSVSGGRSGRVRLVMIAIGVGLGVAMLLAAATIPNLMAARDVRLTARTVELNQPVPQGPDTLLVNSGGTEYRGRTISGELVRRVTVLRCRPAWKGCRPRARWWCRPLWRSCSPPMRARCCAAGGTSG